MYRDFSHRGRGKKEPGCKLRGEEFNMNLRGNFFVPLHKDKGTWNRLPKVVVEAGTIAFKKHVHWMERFKIRAKHRQLSSDGACWTAQMSLFPGMLLCCNSSRLPNKNDDLGMSPFVITHQKTPGRQSKRSLKGISFVVGFWSFYFGVSWSGIQG